MLRILLDITKMLNKENCERVMWPPAYSRSVHECDAAAAIFQCTMEASLLSHYASFLYELTPNKTHIK